MATISVIECEGCGKRVPMGKASGFLRVQTYAATPEDYARLHEDEADASKVPNGDLCSLKCLTSWSSMLQNMREMDA